MNAVDRAYQRIRETKPQPRRHAPPAWFRPNPSVYVAHPTDLTAESGQAVVLITAESGRTVAIGTVPKALIPEGMG